MGGKEKERRKNLGEKSLIAPFSERRKKGSETVNLGNSVKGEPRKKRRGPEHGGGKNCRKLKESTQKGREKGEKLTKEKETQVKSLEGRKKKS